MEYWELSAELAERAYDYEQIIDHYTKHRILDPDYFTKVAVMREKLRKINEQHDELRRRCLAGEKFEWSDLNDY